MRAYAFVTSFLWAATAATSATASPWPQPNFAKTPLSIAEPLLERAECRDFMQFLGLGQGKGTLRSDGVAVLHQGKFLFTVAKEPFDENRVHPIWSSSKSVTSAIVGAAIHAGLKNPSGAKMTLEDHVADYLQRAPTGDAFQDQSFKNLKLRHLLEMGSGFAWSESYEAGIVGSNVLQMVYLSGYKDMAKYVLSQKFVEPGPGKIYNYSSGDMSLVWALLKASCKVTAGCDYDRMPWKIFFEPLGLSSKVAFEQDGAGTYVGSSYVQMSLVDMAKVGYLMLRDGVWSVKQADGTFKETRLLPEGYVKQTRTPGESYLSEATKITNMLTDGVYGLTWWLNVGAKGFDVGSYPSFPPDMYAALGHYGQLIIIIPSQDLVVVRTGADLEYNTKIPKLGELLYPCLTHFGVGGNPT